MISGQLKSIIEQKMGEVTCEVKTLNSIIPDLKMPKYDPKLIEDYESLFGEETLLQYTNLLLSIRTTRSEIHKHLVSLGMEPIRDSFDVTLALACAMCGLGACGE